MFTVLEISGLISSKQFPVKTGFNFKIKSEQN
jgi:hypothetical protein